MIVVPDGGIIVISQLYKMNCIVLLLLYMYIVYYSPLNFLDIGL